MIIKNLKNGFYAVPRDAVTMNGLPLPQLNTLEEPYNGYWHIIAPNGKAIDDEYGKPYLYLDFEEVKENVERLIIAGEYSTC